MDRSEVIRQYRRVRDCTGQICRPLSREDCVLQPVEDVSPPKWHLGHTTWFFEAILLAPHLPGYRPYHPRFAYLFNSYYESLGKRIDRPRRGTLSRPSLDDILDYRKRVDLSMESLIADSGTAEWPALTDLVILGLNHEQQHQELLMTDIKYILASNPLRPAYRADLPGPAGHLAAGDPAFTEFEGGIYRIGSEGDGFAYDNEGPRHRVFVEDFRLGNGLVTNAEYLEFIQDGGYRDYRHWLSDGWNTVQVAGWRAPLYWEDQDGEWFEFSLAGLRPLDPSAPVTHLSYYEADAFAHWAGKRLATEAEWEVAAMLSRADAATGNFLDSQTLHPVPPRPAETVPRQMLGDAWEWTASAYLPYPGYRRTSGPLGEYNGKFMINQMVLRGGSCVTPRDHIRKTYRNFFQPDKRWQFTGLRLAESMQRGART